MEWRRRLALAGGAHDELPLALALVVPDARPGWSRLYLVRGGRVAAERTVAPGALVEIESAVAQARAAARSVTPDL